jgi:hypothetical protein
VIVANNVRDRRAREAVTSALIALPPEVARWAARNVSFEGVGLSASGLCITPSRWHRVVIDEWEADAAVVAHEIAHAFLQHRGRDKKHEQQAAALAAAWGFKGDPADPISVARRFRPEEGDAFRCRVDAAAREVRFVCTCGDVCRATRPNMAGAVLVVCFRCLSRELEAVNELPGLACPRCGTDRAISIVRDALPLLLALEADGLLGALAWMRRGCPGLARWIGRGMPGRFSVRWAAGDSLRISCGTCGARSTVRVAGSAIGTSTGGTVSPIPPPRVGP